MGVQQLLRSLDVGAISPTYGANTDFVLRGWIQAFQPHEDMVGGQVTSTVTREGILHIRCPLVSVSSHNFPIAVDVRLPPRFPEHDPQCRLVHRETGQVFPRGALPINHPAISNLDYTIDLRKMGSVPLRSNGGGTPALAQLVINVSGLVNDVLESAVAVHHQPPPPPIQQGGGGYQSTPPQGYNNNMPPQQQRYGGMLPQQQLPQQQYNNQPQHPGGYYRDPYGNPIVQQQQQPPPPPHSPPTHLQSGNSGPISPTTMQNMFTSGSSPATPNQQLSPATSMTMQHQPQIVPLRASKEIHDACASRVREYLEQREQSLKVLGHLQSSQDTLARLQKSLNDKVQTLKDALGEVKTMAGLCDEVVQLKPQSALKCIDASDPLSAQGFTLLAEVQACDDIMEALERRLRAPRSKNNTNINTNNVSANGVFGSVPGTASTLSGLTSITGHLGNGNSNNNNTASASSGGGGAGTHNSTETPCASYLRAVASIARRQFMAKFLLRKVQGKRLASRSLSSLVNRFPELDASVIRAVLESNAYDAAAAAQRLTEMTKS